METWERAFWILIGVVVIVSMSRPGAVIGKWRSTQRPADPAERLIFGICGLLLLSVGVIGSTDAVPDWLMSVTVIVIGCAVLWGRKYGVARNSALEPPWTRSFVSWSYLVVGVSLVVFGVGCLVTGQRWWTRP
jgi:hypothetical protein